MVFSDENIGDDQLLEALYRVKEQVKLAVTDDDKKQEYYKNMKIDDVIKILQKKRPIININTTFYSNLVSWSKKNIEIEKNIEI